MTLRGNGQGEGTHQSDPNLKGKTSRHTEENIHTNSFLSEETPGYFSVLNVLFVVVGRLGLTSPEASDVTSKVVVLV